MSRLSNLFYVVLGAVAVGAVVAVLAVVGALPDKVERTTITTPTTADAPEPIDTPASLDAKPTSVADIYARVSRASSSSPPAAATASCPSTARAAARPPPARASSSTARAASSPTTTSSTTPTSSRSASARRATRARQDGRRGPLERPRAAQGRREGHPGGVRRSSSQLRGPAPGRRDDRHRQPVRPLGHGHDRHRLGARPHDPLAQRLLDLRRRADRRGDQPRQLGRPAARRARPRHRRQLPDRRPRARQLGRRLRRPGRHGQGHRPSWSSATARSSTRGSASPGAPRDARRRRQHAHPRRPGRRRRAAPRRPHRGLDGKQISDPARSRWPSSATTSRATRSRSTLCATATPYDRGGTRQPAEPATQEAGSEPRSEQ